MNIFNTSFSWLSRLEGLLNYWMLRLFPAWYLSQVAKALELTPIGSLNPPSFLAHRWLSLQSVCQALGQSLSADDAQWQPLVQQLNKLLQEKELSRSYNLMAIRGVEQSKYSDEWPSLIAYANEALEPAQHIQSNDEFNETIEQAFPESQRPHRIVYREWDGRAYWINPQEPTELALLQHYGHGHQRDGQFYAKIHIESLNNQALEKIRHNWWLLVASRNDIEPFAELMRTANLPVTLANFEWRRDDLAILVAPKSSRKVNQVLLSMLHQRSSLEVLELSSYISRHHHPLSKPKKGGDNSPNSG